MATQKRSDAETVNPIAPSGPGSEPEVEQPDFDEEDEAAVGGVWDRIHKGESLDDILAEDAEDEYGDDEDDDWDL